MNELPSRRNALGVLGAGVASASAIAQAAASTRTIRKGASWVVFYGAEADPRILSRFDMVILDPAFRGSLAECSAAGARTLGYVSLGEIARSAQLFQSVRDSAVLLGENLNWSGTYMVDVRQPAWRTLIVQEAIPKLLEQGFTGVFFDTLDTPAHLEATDPIRYSGMRAAAIMLVDAIRRAFPETLLVMNRGYSLLPDVMYAIDGIVAESLITTYNFERKAYEWVPPAIFARQMELLRPARTRLQPLPIFSLDYWHPDDAKTIRTIYERERAIGHSPYVSTILLDQILKEPVP